MLAFYASIALFLIVYALIIWEKYDRTVVAMSGGLLMILGGFLTQEMAIYDDIDFNTIGLLIGMMLLVAITRRSGVFEAVAVWAAHATHGRPLPLLALLAAITAVASALLDNVTAVLLIVPVTLTLTEKLNIHPLPFLITEILACNIGGTATLIGDPPNIMIGSATHLTFTDFLIHMAPIAVVVFLVTTALLVWLYRNDLVVDPANSRQLLELKPEAQIKDWKLLKQSLAVLALTLLGFGFHGLLGLESATIALSGAMLLMLISREEPEDVLLHVEWPTVFFFVGLFMLVGGLKATGVIKALAAWTLSVTGGELELASYLILWLSALASAFIDNIPFVATMIPLLHEFSALSGLSIDSLWWSLALGACLGGNGTLIGASANVIVAGIAAKNGFPLSFRDFFRVAFPFMLLSVALAHLYLYWRYF